MKSTMLHAALVSLLCASVPAGAQPVPATPATPPGADKSARTRVLEAGARALQANHPVAGFDIYLVGFHPMKDVAEQQMASHHYCHQLNEDFAQCMLFDGNTREARLHGIEYIISEKLFATLPVAEREFWHPHNGEILSGQLMAPGLPQAAEKALMRTKMNSYGKTWHVWHTGVPGGRNDPLPLGEPMLAWSFNRDGEIRPGLVEERDRQLGRDTAATRASRAELQKLARPQTGVDAMHGQFNRPTRDIAGVTDAAAAAAPADAAGRANPAGKVDEQGATGR